MPMRACRRARNTIALISRTWRRARRTAGRRSSSRSAHALGDDLERRDAASVVAIGILHQQAAADALEFERARRLFGADAPQREHAHVRLVPRRRLRVVGDSAGAMSTSTNCLPTIAPRLSPSSGRLKAMMPPKAEVGSVANAFVVGVERGPPMATPHGLACLTITQAGVCRRSCTHSSAASASAMLLYESSLPCSMRAPATVPARGCGRGRSAACWCGFSP